MIEKNIQQMYNNVTFTASSGKKLPPRPQNQVEVAINEECDALYTLLVEKNRAYGNSALEPVRIFSKTDSVEQLRVRIDDKLSRFVRGHEFMGDNDIDDLMGYLILLKIAMKESWK